VSLRHLLSSTFSILFNHTAPPETYTLSLHDALPISGNRPASRRPGRPAGARAGRAGGGAPPRAGGRRGRGGEVTSWAFGEVRGRDPATVRARTDAPVTPRAGSLTRRDPAPGTCSEVGQRSGGAADTEGVGPVAVPVADVDLVTGPAVGDDLLRGPAAQLVVHVEHVAAADGEGVLAVAVPVAGEDLVPGAAVGEGLVGLTGAQGVVH